MFFYKCCGLKTRHEAFPRKIPIRISLDWQTLSLLLIQETLLQTLTHPVALRLDEILDFLKVSHVGVF